MDATTIEHAVQQFKSTILERIQHNILQSYTGTPLLEDEQLFFLLLPQFNGVEWSAQVMTGAITTGIVHASLKEHDKILSKEVITKEQQLIVLAGDFYSGRYYQLLAHTGNILLIQKLSAAIIERCEHEVKVYELESRTLSEWIDSLAIIETALIARFYEVFGFEDYTSLMKQVLTIIGLQRILQQRPSSFASQIAKVGQAALVEQVEARKQQLVTMLVAANYPADVKQKILAMVA